MAAVNRVLSSTILALCLVASVAAAQEERPTSSAVPLPVGIASDDDAFAVASNPSLLTRVPRYSIVVAHAREGHVELDRRGTSVYAALASYGRFGGGLGVDRRDDLVYGPRTRLSFAAAYAIGSGLSLGLAYRVVAADGTVDGISSVDVAFTYRPSSRLSLAFVGRDLLAPLDLARARGFDLPASFSLAAGFRPLQSDAFTVEAGFTARTDGVLSGRLFGALAWPRLGRVFVLGTMEDLRGRASPTLIAGLELRLGGIAAGSALVSREAGLGDGFLAYAAVDGRLPTGLVPRDRILEMTLESGPSPRQLVARLLVLDRALRDPHVDGVLLRLHDTDLGLADAQELRQALALFVEAGRPVTCVLESPSGAELYACSVATEIHVEPSAAIRIVGPAVELAAYGGLLERLGIHADFVRIGEFKTAPERFLLERPSAAAIEQTSRYLDDAYARLVGDLARDIGVGSRVIRSAIDEGPLTPERAIGIGLVDDAIDVHDLDSALERVHGRSLPLVGGADQTLDPRYRAGSRVAVVMVEGAIVDRENVVVPFLGTRATGADTLVETLDALADDDSVAAVVLRIDSPGGSATASDRIWRAARRVRARKPLVASLGGIAASGGYYVASAASSIFADPTTLTGSIGVFYGKVDVAPLAERLGIGLAFVERGAHAGATSVFRPFDAEERQHLEELVASSYRLFLSRVAEGRGLSVDALADLAEGRIFSGDRARANGLVDRVGGLVAAVRHARVLANLAADAEVVVLPDEDVGLVERLLGAAPDASLPLRAASALVWLGYLPTEGMLAVAPLDRGAR